MVIKPMFNCSLKQFFHSNYLKFFILKIAYSNSLYSIFLSTFLTALPKTIWRLEIYLCVQLHFVQQQGWLLFQKYLSSLYLNKLFYDLGLEWVF